MKILFINVCLRKGAKVKILPVGLASVMTYSNEIGGYAFDLLDIDINEYSDEYVEDFIKNSNYDVILYGSIVTHYKWIKWITQTIKKYKPATKIVVGNSVASSCYEVFLNNVPADVVVMGEGEITCLEVLKAFENNTSLDQIEGISFKRNGEIVKTPKRKAAKLTEFPMVNWDFFDVKRYNEKAKNGANAIKDIDEVVIMPITTARGCVRRCTFCHFVFWDDPYRIRKPEEIMVEIKRDIEKYGANLFNFWDDLSFASMKQTERLCDAILESGLKFNWNAAVRTDLFGDPRFTFEEKLRVANKMKEAGCISVNFSLESGDEEILKMMEKEVKLEYFAEQIRVLRAAGIISSTSVVFGYPIETKETIRKTFQMCLENKLYPSIGYLLPLPYTGMYQYAKDNGFITDEDRYLTDITERQDFCLNMTKMTTDEIQDEILAGAKMLNLHLNLGLDESRLIKNGSSRNITEKQKVAAGEDEVEEDGFDKIKRNENDFSFNYSQINFDEQGEDLAC